MASSPPTFTTGLPGLDRVLHGIVPGDNIVWEVEAISEYQELVMPYAAAARAAGRHLIYFRFAKHPPLLPEEAGRRFTSSIPPEASNLSSAASTR